MSKLLVKICGITTESQASDIIAIGVDMIGLMFVGSSSRKVSIKNAKQISEMAKQKGVKVVTVFQDQPIEYILNVIDLIIPDYIQLHGGEDVEFCKKIPVRIIKVIKLGGNTKEIMAEYSNVVDLFIIDRKEQGSGDIVDLKQVKELADEFPILLAGGLNPKNISSMLSQVGDNIKGVDVSSGVEISSGIKNLKKVKDFITKVKKI